MRTDDFDYALPPELIAQTPLPRGQSRLLVLHRNDGRIEHRRFADLLEYVRPGDTLVVNDSRVTARRFVAELADGRIGEVLLLRPRGEADWEALVRPGRRLRAGTRLALLLTDGRRASCEVAGTTGEGGRTLRFGDRETRDGLARQGAVPLPPYIRATLADEERYQTVYAGPGGSAAAPTAGLHFTEEMLGRIGAAGVGIARVTLHVGVDTFRPVRADDVEAHEMHGEWYTVSPEDAAAISETRGRVVAVGTTVVRALESAAAATGVVASGTAETRLFITPGYAFRVVGALLTNFHLPRSTLIMLVSAFAGRDRVMEAYRVAIAGRYRFYSFGDAMLID